MNSPRSAWCRVEWLGQIRGGRLPLAIFLLALLVPAPTRGEEPAAPRPIELGSRRELFVDHLLIDRLQDTTLQLHEPVSGGVVVKIEKPWEGPGNFGGQVIRHQGKFILYYRALIPTEDTGVLAVATSDDGVTWTKPSLGSVKGNPAKDTNIVRDQDGNPFMAAIFIDTRPGVPDDEKIKGLKSVALSGERHTAMKDPKGPKRLVAWASGDGIVFHQLATQPDIVSHLPNCFDGGNTMFWSEAEQRYVLYYRFMDPLRTMARITSQDFLHWTAPEAMTYGDSPREQFYVNNTMPYFRAPHLYVALAARFMEGRRGVTPEQSKALGLPNLSGHTYDHDVSDGVLLTSRAGTTVYDRTLLGALVRPGPGAANWTSRTNYPMTGLFPFGADQMMFFVTRHYLQATWFIERLLLRVDGFASVNAPHAGGEMLTKPLTFVGKELEINYRTSAAGRVRIEIQDAAGRPLPGFALADCDEILGDEIDRVVKWKGQSDVSSLANQAVRLRFAMADADLYSLQFKP